ncbi:MAG TPA: Stp1/IreP family PP2C-type Ser/Thr phosphatase [Thermoanaerobaculia bacterium]|nr:Stp1/IreP family PP2C-type Ser/Thr phosphatase [Thermoanaerobaculia bacterium]
MALTAYGLTDVGRKRKHNEDAYLLDAERGLFVVADGMGGHAAGEVASRLTVESIQEFIAGTEDDHDNTWPFGYNNRYSVDGNRLSTAVERANEKVMRAVVNRPELKGMGTTVVAALFDEKRATLVHVGDSRAYLFRDSELRRLTDDHSWVQEQVNAGILSEEEARSHPLKNVVTRALGGGAHVAVDLIEIPVGDGDRFLLCSDGLTGMVSDEEITEALSSSRSLEQIVRGLIDLANERGGVDNITAITVEVRNGDAKKVDTSREKTSVSLRAAKVDDEDLTPTDEIPVPVVEAAPETPPSGVPAKGEETSAPAGGEAEGEPGSEPKG